jgi:hypothetical protein
VPPRRAPRALHSHPKQAAVVRRRPLPALHPRGHKQLARPAPPNAHDVGRRTGTAAGGAAARRARCRSIAAQQLAWADISFEPKEQRINVAGCMWIDFEGAGAQKKRAAEARLRDSRTQPLLQPRAPIRG